jgi:hypothetical protein
MYDIPFDRSFLQLSNGIRHVMPSTDTKPKLTAKASMAQPVSQPAVYANGLMYFSLLIAEKAGSRISARCTLMHLIISALVDMYGNGPVV